MLQFSAKNIRYITVKSVADLTIIREMQACVFITLSYLELNSPIAKCIIVDDEAYHRCVSFSSLILELLSFSV